ncbi:hypothetical protein COCVIDRAFT_112563 [Bipolaris victoriae FI3]|uniref:Uncharacterized protein n=1 Tax=Bipolaris victoriae (strain FI3) TaxID=930091 RepID=W7E7P4_BIPV3|nr:hypothetical protein COCVIDRAFT_112563 [Bipolaris victoriae FI3]
MRNPRLSYCQATPHSPHLSSTASFRPTTTPRSRAVTRCSRRSHDLRKIAVPHRCRLTRNRTALTTVRLYFSTIYLHAVLLSARRATFVLMHDNLCHVSGNCKSYQRPTFDLQLFSGPGSINV